MDVDVNAENIENAELLTLKQADWDPLSNGCWLLANELNPRFQVCLESEASSTTYDLVPQDALAPVSQLIYRHTNSLQPFNRMRDLCSRHGSRLNTVVLQWQKIGPDNDSSTSSSYFQNVILKKINSL